MRDRIVGSAIVGGVVFFGGVLLWGTAQLIPIIPKDLIIIFVVSIWIAILAFLYDYARWLSQKEKE